MATISNSYAEKVFSEHPIALWSLDEQVDYVSLITENNRNLSNSWVFKDKTNTTIPVEDAVEVYTVASTWLQNFPSPVFDSLANQIFVPNTLAGSTGNELNITSPVFIQQSDVDVTVKTISIASYFYTFNKRVSIDIGFEYTDENSDIVRSTQKAFLLGVEEWQFVSETFELPNMFSDLKLVFDISYDSPTTDYYILMHGLSVGQWSEQFNVESLGVNLVQLPSSLSISGHGAGAKTYGLQDVSGYYIAKDNRLCANNSGLPMVFGAENATVIRPNTVGEPSMILPGYGFMNAEGQYSDLTLEMWLKIQSSATTPKRVFGPVGSDDGLYVNDAFIVLKVGQYNASYYVGEWDRPMLTAIRMSSEVASLIINGEEVITLDIDPSQVTFPNKLNEDGKDQNWLGFYAYDDVPSIELDCVGIYPYEVPAIVEKRRWVYGQGVETSESITGSTLGTTVSMDYTFANYAKNYSYPDIGRWNQGIVENLVADNASLSLPQYTLPTMRFSNKTTDQWLTDNNGLTALFGTYVSLRPTAGWSTTEGYMLFSNLNLLQQDLKAFYGLFESDATNSAKQVLFLMENEVTGESLEITLQGAETAYTFKYLESINGVVSEQEDVIYSDTFHTPGDFLFAGIDINKFATNFGGRISKFLGSKQQLKLYVGGNKNLTNTFSGNIYRIGFCTARNLEKISNVFATTGLPAGFNAFDSQFSADAGNAYFGNDNSYVVPLTGQPYWTQFYDGGDQYFGNSSEIFEEQIDGGNVYSLLVTSILDHVASYTLVPKTYLGNFVLDIAVNGYWQDYLPLSYFSKFVKAGTADANGVETTYKDLDFIQFNVDYPQINKFLAKSFDTTESIIRTFVSFQELKDDAAISVKRFPKTILAPKNGVVAPGDDWQTVNADESIDYIKYEVVNDTVIYPPANMDFNQVSIVLHVEIISEGMVENPVKIKSLQLASQVLNVSVPNPVGTKFGVNVYPYKKSAEFYDYKSRNPFSIYKGSAPYLYMTSTSGMRLRGFYPGSVARGVSVPLNNNVSSFYKIAAMQFALRYDNETFPQDVTELFEIFAKSSTLELAGDDYIRHIKFYMIPDDSALQRGRIYAINADTGIEEDGILFYINGKRVLNPVVNSNTWSMLGISFATPVDFSGYEGAFRVTGPILFNNISFYQSSEADEAARSVYRKWSSIKIVDNIDKDWDYWKTFDADPDTVGTQLYTWRNVLFISSQDIKIVSGKSIYKKYTGTERITVDSDNVFRMNGYKYSFYKDTSWQTASIIPA